MPHLLLGNKTPAEMRRAHEQIEGTATFFESIHLFDDRNGRLGRASVEQPLIQNIGQLGLLALVFMIERKNKA